MSTIYRATAAKRTLCDVRLFKLCQAWLGMHQSADHVRFVSTRPQASSACVAMSSRKRCNTWEIALSHQKARHWNCYAHCAGRLRPASHTAPEQSCLVCTPDDVSIHAE